MLYGRKKITIHYFRPPGVRVGDINHIDHVQVDVIENRRRLTV